MTGMKVIKYRDINLLHKIFANHLISNTLQKYYPLKAFICQTLFHLCLTLYLYPLSFEV